VSGVGPHPGDGATTFRLTARPLTQLRYGPHDPSCATLSHKGRGGHPTGGGGGGHAREAALAGTSEAGGPDAGGSRTGAGVWPPPPPCFAWSPSPAARERRSDCLTRHPLDLRAAAGEL